MNTNEKIIITILWTLGAIILILMMPRNNANLRNRFLNSNPNQMKQFSWFFSKSKKRAVEFLILLLTIGWLILVWTNQIDPILNTDE